jgi:hypothetical protein
MSDHDVTDTEPDREYFAERVYAAAYHAAELGHTRQRIHQQVDEAFDVVEENAAE